MGAFIDVILSNKIYMIFAACIVGIMVYFVIKKAIKLFIYALIILIVFLSFIYVFS